jgi:hypothetical protein
MLLQRQGAPAGSESAVPLRLAAAAAGDATALSPGAGDLRAAGVAGDAADGDETELARLFNAYLSPGTTTDKVPEAAARLVGEVFNEEDDIAGKVWELRILLQERLARSSPSAEEQFKTLVLQRGLANVARDRRFENLARDAAIILGSSTGLALLSGVRMPFSPGDVASLWRRAATAGREYGRLGSLPSLREAGEIFSSSFQRFFHRLTAEERLARDLAALGVKKEDVLIVRENLLASVAESGPPSIMSAGSPPTFYRTNLKNISVGGIVPPQATDERYGYLIFRVSRKTALRRKTPPYYMSTNLLPKDEIERISAQLYYGKDKRKFVQLTVLGEPEEQTRVLADRLQDLTDKFDKASEWVRGHAPSFNGARAGHTFIISAGLLSSGYALASARDRYFSEIYIGSLLEGIEANGLQAPSPQQPEPLGR